MSKDELRDTVLKGLDAMVRISSALGADSYKKICSELIDIRECIGSLEGAVVPDLVEDIRFIKEKVYAEGYRKGRADAINNS